MKNKIKDLIDLELSAIKNIPIDASYNEAVQLIYNCTKRYSGKVIATGIGKAGHIAHNIAMTLSSTGTPGVFVHPTEAQHGDMGIIETSDVLLVISNSGKTREVLELIDLAKKIYPHIKIIGITGDNKSKLSEVCDVVLWTGGGKEIDKFGLVPTTSTTLMTVIGDILVVNLMDKIGFTKEHYQLLHHSGYISEKLKENSE